VSVFANAGRNKLPFWKICGVFAPDTLSRLQENHRQAAGQYFGSVQRYGSSAHEWWPMQFAPAFANSRHVPVHQFIDAMT
jgi:hypothetical protein